MKHDGNKKQGIIFSYASIYMNYFHNEDKRISVKHNQNNW